MTGVNESVRELIQRRRLQLLVHSCIYYEYNESLVTDEQWKNWAVELETLQKEYKTERAGRKILCKRFSTKVKNGAGKQGEFWPESLDYRKPWRSERYARRHGVNAGLTAVAY